MVFNNNLLLGAAGQASGYEIDQSIRFNDGDSPYLNRTLGTPTSSSQFGYSFWVKLGADYDGKYIISANGGGNNDNFTFSSNKLRIQEGGVLRLQSNQLFRDFSSWYHFVVAYDLGNATASQKLRVYLNGSEITSWATDTRSSLSSTSSRLNAAVSHDVGANVFNGVSSHINNWDGYIAEFHFVDGAVLTPTDFGETNADTGQWVPIAYTGSYGTNGFYITGADSADLGADDSGNGNDFTSSGLAAADQVSDSPTDNFCVLNPIDTATTGTLSDGNLVTSGNAKVTMRPSSGQWYYEKDGVGVSYDADTSGQFDPTLTAGTYNFGQSAWSDTGPTGSEKVLSTANLPDPTIADPAAYFQTTLYTGNGTAIGSGGKAVDQSGNSTFQPDFVWIKNRSAADNHMLYDAVRGATKDLHSNTADAEATDTEGLSTFDADGFTVGSNVEVNTNTENYVGWQWKANGSGSSNTDGTVTSTVSADATSGFSIAKWTHTTASNYTVGHGLGAVPKMILVKTTDQGTNWGVYHSDITVGNRLLLNSTSAQIAGYWGANSWTTSTFSIGSARDANGSTMIGYSFAEVEGFSKFGSYTGNGSTDGPFVFTGFKPKFIMYKRTSGGTGNWDILDAERDPINVADAVLAADTNTAETTYATIKIDMLSNGYKIRGTQTNLNASGSTYNYMAFAETQFKTATAR